MDEPLSLDLFMPSVGKRVGFEGQSMTLLLAEAEAKPRAAMPDAERVPFVLRFQGPSEPILPPGIYRAVFEDGPVVELHIVPIHTVSRDRQDYQAVFN